MTFESSEEYFYIKMGLFYKGRKHFICHSERSEESIYNNNLYITTIYKEQTTYKEQRFFTTLQNDAYDTAPTFYLY